MSKPKSFKRREWSKGCFNCGNLELRQPTNSTTNFPIPGHGQYFCTKHTFPVAGIKDQQNYLTRSICDDHKLKKMELKNERTDNRDDESDDSECA